MATYFFAQIPAIKHENCRICSWSLDFKNKSQKTTWLPSLFARITAPKNIRNFNFKNQKCNMATYFVVEFQTPKIASVRDVHGVSALEKNRWL